MNLKSDSNVHVYRQSKRTRLFLLLMGFFSAAVGTAITILSLHATVNARLNAYLMPVIGLAVVCFGALQARTYWRRVLILSNTSVGTEFTFFFRELNLKDVAGKRIRLGKQGPQTILIPKSRGLPKVVIHSGFVVDKFFESWISSLPDLDHTLL